MREPRATKSFRDAADRIVRQEAATPESISRLLGAPALSAHRATTDAQAWDVRLAALATIAQYDGLTFAILGRAEAAAAYNLVDDLTGELAIRDAVDQVARSGATMQLRGSVPLADGRIATAVLVTPLVPNDALAGALIALRVGRPFVAVDAYTAVGIAQIVSLELARSVDTRREEVERRQALALYELARHALFIEDPGEALQSIAMVLASTLDHDAAHVWLRGSDRSLRSHAAYPPDQLGSTVIWENDHIALAGALRERRLVRVSGAAPWMPANTREALVVPLRGDPRPLGVLVLARAHAPYRLDDIEMADVVGTFIGRVVAAASRSTVSQQDAYLAGPVSDVGREAELAEGRERN
ncbi:MAG: GAF domain-containing protein [Chloroflexota bacterium]|nr:GAF domain-containing protein [Chloroflexota bacterium]